MHDPVLERFHRALIEEIQTQRPEYLTAPFTVAEIYQNLVPYGSHRDRIGVEMNGDYEYALLRLLAGEGGLLILDSEPALRDLRAELETANPNTGIYREFAAVDVRLNQAYLDLSSSALDELPDLAEALDADEPVTMSALAPSAAGAPAQMDIVPPGVDIFAPPAMEEVEAPRSPARPPLAPEFVEEATPPKAPAPSRPAPAAAKGACPWCSEALPSRDGLNFCPFCGTDLNLVPCRSCGSEIEKGWRFCASCGAEAGD